MNFKSIGVFTILITINIACAILVGGSLAWVNWLGAGFLIGLQTADIVETIARQKSR